MKFIWPALLGVFRTVYLVYAFWCFLFPVALLGWGALLLGDFGASPPGLRQAAQLALAGCGVLAVFAVVAVYRRRTPGDPNPWQSGFMAWFGTLKWFRNGGGADAVKLHWPSAYLVENPHGYRIGGPELRAVLALLQPGDILLRGYQGYVDGEFIRRSSRSAKSGFRPGWFTHVALYAGELTAQDQAHVSAAFASRPDYFSPGPQRVIHAMAKGVHTEDILTFLRCDFLAVLRLPAQMSLAAGGLVLDHRSRAGQPLLASDVLGATLTQTLRQGHRVARAQVVAAARLSALEKIGQAYDFDSSDTREFNRFSCSELLYYCLRGVLSALQLQPQAHALYPLAPWFTRWRVLERRTITPDDYDDLVSGGYLERIWEDAASQAARHRRSAAPPTARP